MDATAAPDAAEVPEVDPAQPATTLQIRLHDGRRVRAQLNMHHTVRHVQAIIARFVLFSRRERVPSQAVGGFVETRRTVDAPQQPLVACTRDAFKMPHIAMPLMYAGRHRLVRFVSQRCPHVFRRRSQGVQQNRYTYPPPTPRFDSTAYLPPLPPPFRAFSSLLWPSPWPSPPPRPPSSPPPPPSCQGGGWRRFLYAHGGLPTGAALGLDADVGAGRLEGRLHHPEAGVMEL